MLPTRTWYSYVAAHLLTSESHQESPFRPQLPPFIPTVSLRPPRNHQCILQIAVFRLIAMSESTLLAKLRL